MTLKMGVRLRLLIPGLLAACLLPGVSASAQGDRSDTGGGFSRDAAGHLIGPSDPVDTGSYRTDDRGPIRQDEDTRTPFTDDPTDVAPPNEDQNTGPVRLARFSFVSGNVTWRPDDQSEWSKATINLPIRQGAQIWVTEGGHADVQFDDGSELRLGNGALATLKTLYSDKDGEFTQIALNEGLATLHSRHDNAIYQLDTPFASVKTRGATQIRFGVDSGSEITVQHGDATIEGPQGNAELHAGDYLFLADANAPFKIGAAPPRDSWDQWNDDRNRVLEGRQDSHVPSNIGLVAGDLDQYGTWRSDPAYGQVWCPRVSSPEWRPYYDGHWTWVDPFGWTWVSNEPWGWAPYHYGTWVHLSYGWGWCPGPVHQYWSPAVVNFSVYDGCVAWARLCPWEVHYPSAISFDYWGNRWAFSFSIGTAGCYYPSGAYCVGRPFSTRFVNRFDRFRDFDRARLSPSFDRFARSNEFAASHFIPHNARNVAGGSFARLDAFGGQGRYQALGRSETTYWTRGRQSALPAAGRIPVAGPPSVNPTASSRTPLRTFTSARPSQTVLNRQTYHAPSQIGGIGRQRADIAAGRTGDRRPSLGGNAGVAGAGRPTIAGNGGAASTGSTSRIGIEDGRVHRPNSGQTGVTGGSASNGRPWAGSTSSGREWAGSSATGADAARRARASLGVGGSASPGYGSSSRSGSNGRENGGTSASGTHRDGTYSGRTDTTHSPGTIGGRTPDQSPRSNGSRTYGGSDPATPRSSTGAGSGSYRSGGSESSSGRSGGYIGAYGSGRSRGGDGSESNTGRSGGSRYDSGRTPSGSTGRSDTYNGSRSGSYDRSSGGYSGGRSDTYSGSRSGSTYGGRSGSTYGGPYGDYRSGRSDTYSGGRSGGYSGRSDTPSSGRSGSYSGGRSEGYSGSRSSGDSGRSGGGYSGGRSGEDRSGGGYSGGRGGDNRSDGGSGGRGSGYSSGRSR